MCVFLCVSLCTWRRPEEGSNPLEPELQTIVSFLEWILGIELGSFGGTVYVLPEPSL